MKLHSVLLSTLVATIALTACQPQSGIVKARPNAAPESPASATPTPIEQTGNPDAVAKTAEDDKVLADDPTPVPPADKPAAANDNQGKYFYVFLDMYENEKGAELDHPAQMMKYLLSAQ